MNREERQNRNLVLLVIIIAAALLVLFLLVMYSVYGTPVTTWGPFEPGPAVPQ